MREGARNLLVATYRWLKSHCGERGERATLEKRLTGMREGCEDKKGRRVRRVRVRRDPKRAGWGKLVEEGKRKEWVVMVVVTVVNSGSSSGSSGSSGSSDGDGGDDGGWQ